MEYKQKIKVSFPIVLGREGKWFVASCPLLDIGTQGKTEKEARENMQELIKDYFNDPDTKKPTLKEIMAASVSLIKMPVDVVIESGKTSVVRSR